MSERTGRVWTAEELERVKVLAETGEAARQAAAEVAGRIRAWGESRGGVKSVRLSGMDWRIVDATAADRKRRSFVVLEEHENKAQDKAHFLRVMRVELKRAGLPVR